MWFYDQKLPFRDRPLFSKLDALLNTRTCFSKDAENLTVYGYVL